MVYARGRRVERDKLPARFRTLLVDEYPIYLSRGTLGTIGATESIFYNKLQSELVM